MTRRSSPYSTIAAIAVLLAGLVLMPAAAPAAQEVAVASAAGASIQWAPLVDYHRLVLTVSGGGAVFRSEFPAEQTPSFELVDRDGKALPDGSYVWELTVVPHRAKQDRSTGGDQGMEPRRSSPTQTGYFFVRDGAVVDAAAEARGLAPAAGAPAEDAGPIVPKDQVIADDLIVNGSACIGLDCVNGESFGFDTLRVKENNVRIRFVDTSTTASFPTNDWELTANDSSNGGANRFSITDIDAGRAPFTILAGAPANSLYVNSAGRLGIRTATPVVDVHIKQGNTPTLRLEQDGSSGFSPQTWDVAGNEANYFIRDVTNGSTLPFKILPGAGNNSIVINASSNVGIGTAAPAQKLHVKNGNLQIGATDEASTRAIRFSNSINEWLFQNNGTTGAFAIRDATGTATPFVIEAAAPANLFKLTSAGTIEVLLTQVHPDYVFEPEYDLETIEEHAAYMWENKHLPAVGAGRYNEEGQAVLNLATQPFAILEELEKAHIYIEQLNGEITELEAKTAEIDELKAQLARLEALIAAQASEK